jgi:hypothetical protein
VNVPVSVPDTLVTVLAAGNLVNSAGAAWCVACGKPDNKTIDSSDSTLGRRLYFLRIMMKVLKDATGEIETEHQLLIEISPEPGDRQGSRSAACGTIAPAAGITAGDTGRHRAGPTESD